MFMYMYLREEYMLTEEPTLCPLLEMIPKLERCRGEVDQAPCRHPHCAALQPRICFVEPQKALDDGRQLARGKISDRALRLLHSIQERVQGTTYALDS